MRSLYTDTFRGGKPGADVVAAARMLPPRAHVLDLGCGEGRNALYLASLGHQVAVADITQTGISRPLTARKPEQVSAS